MRKLFLSAALVLGLGYGASVQAQCPNTSLTTPGLNPDSLPAGTINTPYSSKDLTIVFPEKVTIDLAGAGGGGLPGGGIPPVEVTYTKYIVDTTGGLPNGLAFDLGSCTPAGCEFTNFVANGNQNYAYGCITITGGTPDSADAFLPFIEAKAIGTFVMPSLGPIGGFIPGLPAAGTIIKTDSLEIFPEVAQTPFGAFPLRSLVEQAVARIRFETELLILPEQLTPLCNPSVPYSAGQQRRLKPFDQPETTQNQPFNGGAAQNIVLDVNPKTEGQGFVAVLTKFRIVSTSDLPAGMNFSIDGCPNTGTCVLNNPLSVDEGANRFCFTLSGTPTESGQFSPAVNLEAEGSISGSFNGTSFSLDIANPNPASLPAALPDQVKDQIIQQAGNLRNQSYTCTLTVTPAQLTPLCVQSIPFSEDILKPAAFPNGNKDQAYAEIDVVFDMPTTKRINFSIPQVPVPIGGDVKVSEFEVLALNGLPAGMNFSGNACVSGCVKNVDQLDINANRICFKAGGTPTVGGNFVPGLDARFDGEVSIPALGTFLLSQPPAQAAAIIEGLRNVRYESSLRINGGTNREDAFVAGFTVFPNPTSKSATVSYMLKQSAPAVLQLTDVTGRVVWSFNDEKAQAGENLVLVDLSTLPVGLYNLTINVGGSTTARKVVRN
jgi:hypothetical protein